MQVKIRKGISANKNSVLPAPGVKEEEKIIFQPVISENKTEENPIAKKEEKKKADQVEEPVVAKNTEPKKDSVAAVVENQAVASAIKANTNKDEYQTIASIVNKKVRSILGIKKSTECATSDKVGLWDLAMAAKRGIQNRMGTKAIDVNKICDGTNGKVEYVFAAGEFWNK